MSCPKLVISETGKRDIQSQKSNSGSDQSAKKREWREKLPLPEEDEEKFTAHMDLLKTEYRLSRILVQTYKSKNTENANPSVYIYFAVYKKGREESQYRREQFCGLSAAEFKEFIGGDAVEQLKGVISQLTGETESAATGNSMEIASDTEAGSEDGDTEAAAAGSGKRKVAAPSNDLAKKKKK